jgi:hypothetical protein
VDRCQAETLGLFPSDLWTAAGWSWGAISLEMSYGSGLEAVGCSLGNNPALPARFPAGRTASECFSVERGEYTAVST